VTRNLRLVIGALLAAYVLTLLAIKVAPDAADTIEKLGNLVIGGLLAIMRPSSHAVEPRE
jgi:hypothetical protein